MTPLPVLNNQTPEKRADGDGTYLDIQEIFPTIQGEGPWVGTPAVFIRTAGCNLQCPACDTDYTSKRKSMYAWSIMAEVKGLFSENRTPGYVSLERMQGRLLVVITGGEPLRQPLGYLVGNLRHLGYSVQIETNGTLYDETLRDFYRDIMLVCSPKTPTINPLVAKEVTVFKYVLQHDKVDPDDGLPTSSLDSLGRPARPPERFVGRIYVQPCDEKDEVKNALNTKATVESCMRYGYTLCLQTHKLVGLP